MEMINLFLNINKPGLNNEWNSSITEALKALPSAEQVMIVENNESSKAQISISYKFEELSFNLIEEVVVNSGANITDINIHFLSDITGVADPYSAAAASLPIDESMKKIDGVLGAAISSSGIVKVELDISVEDKQKTFDEILKTLSGKKPGTV